MKNNFSKNLPVLLILILVVLACRCGKIEPPAKQFDAQKFNPFRGSVEELLEAKVSGHGGSDWELKEKKKIGIDGAVEAFEAAYEERYGWGNSYQPDKIKVLIVNYPAAEAAREHFRRFVLSGAEEDKISRAYRVKNNEVGRLITNGKRAYWTNGSLYCEAVSGYDNGERFQRLVAY